MRKFVWFLVLALVAALSGPSFAQITIIAPTNAAEPGRDVELLVRVDGFDPNGLNLLQLGPKGKLLVADPKVVKIKSITGLNFLDFTGKKPGEAPAVFPWKLDDLKIAPDGSSATFRASLPAGKGQLTGDVLKVVVTCLAAGQTRVGFDKVRIGTARIGGGDALLGAGGRQDILVTIEGTKQIKIVNKGPATLEVLIEAKKIGEIAAGKDLTTAVKFGQRVTVKVKERDKGAEIVWEFIGDAFAFDAVKDKAGADLGVAADSVVGAAVVCGKFGFANRPKVVAFEQMSTLTGVPEDSKKLESEFKRLGRAPKGGTLRYASFANPRTFNPVLIRETSSSIITNRWAAALIEGGPSGAEPGLAESFELSEDQRSVTITLREGLRWCEFDKVKKDAKGVPASCDGPPFTIDDVLFSFTKIFLDPTLAARRITRSQEFYCLGGRGKDCPTVEKVGPRSMKVTWPRPFAFALDPFSDDEVCCTPPRHELEAAGVLKPDGTVDPDKFRAFAGVGAPLSQLSGLGPFTPVGVPATLNVGARFQRNPNFWRIDELGNQLPYLDGMDYSIVPDLGVMALKYTSGELDVLNPRAVDLAAIESRVGAVTRLFIGGEAVPGPGADFIGFNQDVGLTEDFTKERDPAKRALRAVFRHPEFRRAMSNLWDRVRIADEVQQGLAGPRFVPGIGGGFGDIQFRPDFDTKIVKELEFSLAKAAARLDALGLKPGADGIRVIPAGWGFVLPGRDNKLDSKPAGDDVLVEDKAIGLGPMINPGPNGKLDTTPAGDDVANKTDTAGKIEFELITNAGNTIREQSQTIFAADAAKIGVKVNSVFVDFVTLVNRILSPAGPWDAVQVGITADWRGPGVMDSCGDLHFWKYSDCTVKNDPKLPDDREPYQKRVDELAELFLVTLDNASIIAQANEFLFLTSGNVPLIYRTTGVALGAVRIDRIANIQEVPLGAAGPGVFTQSIIFRIDLRPGAAAATANRIDRRVTVE